MGVLLLAGSVGFALDDPTEPTTAASPTTLLERRSHRLVPTAGATVAGWGASVAAAGEGAVGGPTLMLVGLGLACAAAAAVATHRAPGRAGVVASTFALASVLVLSRLPERWTMLPRPGGSLDRAAVLRWIGIAAVALGALVVACREPARTRWHRCPAAREPAPHDADGHGSASRSWRSSLVPSPPGRCWPRTPTVTARAANRSTGGAARRPADTWSWSAATIGATSRDPTAC
jgi:hypothetical protein